MQMAKSSKIQALFHIQPRYGIEKRTIVYSSHPKRGGKHTHHHLLMKTRANPLEQPWQRPPSQTLVPAGGLMAWRGLSRSGRGGSKTNLRGKGATNLEPLFEF
ncbi:hypothetical protein Mapa_015498 [Marchantia paleacea]|nr:hypothetical protein Mapa_015498 [Marchantia paleacea]